MNDKKSIREALNEVELIHNRDLLKIENKLIEIEKIINQLCSEYVGRFDFWTTPYGRRILEIKGILNEVESE
jgi:uncharacterized protein YeeX (DUF496 family)